MKQNKSCKECGKKFTTYRDSDFCSLHADNNTEEDNFILTLELPEEN